MRPQESHGVLAVEDLAQAVLLFLRRGVDVEVIDLQKGQGLRLDEAVPGQEHGEAIVLVQLLHDVVQPDLLDLLAGRVAKRASQTVSGSPVMFPVLTGSQLGSHRRSTASRWITRPA